MALDPIRRTIVNEEIDRAESTAALGGTTLPDTKYRHLRRLASKILAPIIGRQFDVNMALVRVVRELQTETALLHEAIDGIDPLIRRSTHQGSAETADASGWETSNAVLQRLDLLDLRRRVDALDPSSAPSHPHPPYRVPALAARSGEGLRVTVHGTFSGFNGLSAASRRVVADLLAAGVTVTLDDFGGVTPLAPELLDEDFHDLERSSDSYLHIWTQNTVEFHLIDDEDFHPRDADRYNIGTWWWETPSMPDHLAAQARRVDELWVASPTIRSALFGATDAPVQVFQQSLRPFSPNRSRAEVLGELGLSDDRPTFLCTFDARSVPARKNPDGVVEAFRRAFGGRTDDAQLIIKTHSLDVIGEYRDWFEPVVESVGGILVDATYSDQEFTNLMAAADVYVSLHRAEGLGLGMAEAMSLGIPVIATAFSGNRVFLDHASACLVGFTVREITREDVFYNPELLTIYTLGLLWADPDLNQAAEWMRLLASDHALRAAMGAAGKRAVDYRFDQQRTGGEMVKRLWEIMDAKDRSRMAQDSDAEEGPVESTDGHEG